MRKVTRISLLFLNISIVSSILLVNVYASTYSQLQDAEREKTKAESAIEDAQDDINQLNTERASLQTYLDQLNTQLSKTSAERSEERRVG